jgi:tRNA(fMet)-specific endonuclease VapC
MILLDTDHLTVLKYPEGSQCEALQDRLEASGELSFATTIVTVEEQLRGWLAAIHRLKDVHKQIPAYERLARLLEFLNGWQIVPFDEPAADEFKLLRKQRLKLGTMDLKIASIALVNEALLLSANLRDFERVPGLNVENWLE